MRTLAEILGGLTGLYMLLIMVRIAITWFSRGDYGGPYEFLCRITDPYLDWFRRFPAFRTAALDFSPIAAMAALSVIQHIFMILSTYGRITVGLVLAMILRAAWSAASFLLGFFIIILILRLAAGVFRWGGTFWNVIGAISRPILYRIERLFFRNRLVNYRAGIALSLGILALLFLLGNYLAGLFLPLLENLPV